jgi:hypothetical protein
VRRGWWDKDVVDILAAIVEEEGRLGVA